jgi:tetratricopeptide (TPR) repeat protein
MMRDRGREMIAMGRSAEAGARSAGPPESVAWPLEIIGIGYALLRRPEDAVAYFEAALELAGPGDRGYTLNSLAVTYTSLWRLPEARRHGTASLTHARTAGDPRGICLALVNLARIAMRQGRLTESFTLAQESHTRSLSAGYDMGVSTARLTAADALRHLGRTEEALEWYELSLQAAEDLAYFDNVIDTLHGLGALHRDQGNPHHALTFHTRGDTLHADGHAHVDHPALSNERARTEQACGLLETAAATATRALDQARRVRNPFEEGRALEILAETTPDDPATADRLAQAAAIRTRLLESCDGELLTWSP